MNFALFMFRVPIRIYEKLFLCVLLVQHGPAVLRDEHQLLDVICRSIYSEI